MDKTNTRQSGEGLGIVETSVLGSDYANSLFASDSDDIVPVGTKLKEEDKVDEGPVTSFLGDDDDLIGSLGNNKKKPQQRRDDSQETEEENDEDQDEDEEEVKDKKSQNKKDKKPQQSKEEEEEEESDDDESGVETIIPDFAKELFQMGLFTLDEDEDEVPTIGSPQELVERFRYENRKSSVQILENILSQHGDDYKDAFDAIYVNGVHPRDYFGHIERINNLATLDMSIVENQKMVLKHYYETILGNDANKASTKIERSANDGYLEEDSKEAHQALISREDQELQNKTDNKRQELHQRARQEQEFQSGVQKILGEKMKSGDFDGIPVDEKIIRETAGYLLDKKWQMKDGRQISEFEKDIFDLERPDNKEMKTKVALLLQLMKSDPTFSRLQKKVVSRETNELFKSLQREKTTNKRQGKKSSNFLDD